MYETLKGSSLIVYINIPKTAMEFQEHLISHAEFWPFSYLRHNFMKDSLACGHPAGATMLQRVVVVIVREEISSSFWDGAESCPILWTQIIHSLWRGLVSGGFQGILLLLCMQEGSQPCGMPLHLCEGTVNCVSSQVWRYIYQGFGKSA